MMLTCLGNKLVHLQKERQREVTPKGEAEEKQCNIHWAPPGVPLSQALGQVLTVILSPLMALTAQWGIMDSPAKEIWDSE